MGMDAQKPAEIKKEFIEDPSSGLLFVDPEVYFEDFKPAKKVRFQEAIAYADRIRREEHRQVTYEEMQQFVER